MKSIIKFVNKVVELIKAFYGLLYSKFNPILEEVEVYKKYEAVRKVYWVWTMLLFLYMPMLLQHVVFTCLVIVINRKVKKAKAEMEAEKVETEVSSDEDED